MATERQIQANRLNALKSTGPKTPEGKEAVSQNAIKHGLSARRAVLDSESQADFEMHREGVMDEIDPIGPIETMLAMRVVTLSWRLARTDNLQALALNTLHVKTISSPIADIKRALHGQSEPDPDLDFGRTITHDFACPRVLDRLLMYERRIENSLYKTINEIKRLKRRPLYKRQG